MKKQSVNKKDVVIGLGIGLGIGLLALAGILVLARPWRLTLPATQVPGPTSTHTPVPVTATSAPTISQEPSPPPTSTVEPTVEPSGPITYTVQEGDILSGIAYRLHVTVEAIMDASGLTSPDWIYPGDILTIPVHMITQPNQEKTPSPGDAAPAESSTPESNNQIWQPSILEGDLDPAYPGILEAERFTLHYTPGTYPAQDPQAAADIVTRGLDHLEQVMNAQLDGRFDVYVAGSIFAPPDEALRGRSFSASRRYFFLHDGTGNLADQQYIATHELTHLFTWNVFGQPASAMLSEGAAVYTGITVIADSRHMPTEVFCAAYYQAGELPRISTNISFRGHIRDLPNYYAAGCFVQYLTETYGPEKFGQLYPTGDYVGVYGQSLAALEQEWLSYIDASELSMQFAPSNLIEAVDAVGTAYDELFADFQGTPTEMVAYQELDKARLALLEGRLEDSATHLTEFRQILNSDG